MNKENENIWMCILTEKNFEIVEKVGVYGIPDNPRALKELKKVRVGDILIFYAISPARRFLGISKVTSAMFEERKETLWEDRIYPYRVKISKVERMNLPFKAFKGRTNSIGKRIPMGKSLIPIHKDDFETIKKLANS